jgi:ATP-binding cassette, subfamily B, bacterial MsbA
VIAHRLSTVKRADKIIVLDQGRVIEEGTHDALIAKGGLYAQLQQAQLRD